MTGAKSWAKYWCEPCRMYVQLAQTTRKDHENSRKHKENQTKFTNSQAAAAVRKKKEEQETAKQLKNIEVKALLSLADDLNKPKHPVAPNARVHSFGGVASSSDTYDYRALRAFYASDEYKQLKQQDAGQNEEQEDPAVTAYKLALQQKKEQEKTEEEEYDPEKFEPEFENEEEQPHARDSSGPVEPLLGSWTSVPVGEEVFVDKVVEESQQSGEVNAESGEHKDDESDSDSEEEVAAEKRAKFKQDSDSEEEKVTFKRKSAGSMQNKKNFRRKTSGE
eukprot:TRINITY_DN7098_c0_g1_i1.p1 TRINITY_DN7098_c0_g1~~TRINITY_DN7098_c0_g1_i1.p1  ORF type:complete len:278 (+),score=70.72 TRINITY_DN7098_c0_g1_i1:100-933(+)